MKFVKEFIKEIQSPLRTMEKIDKIYKVNCASIQLLEGVNPNVK